VATIARLGYKRGVPKAQSLRNKTGESYRALLLHLKKNIITRSHAWRSEIIKTKPREKTAALTTLSAEPSNTSFQMNSLASGGAISEYGEIVDGTGIVVLKAATEDAVKKY
jgi:hypothetical protein